jgi:predicted AAA+ superfamily ATPase
MYTRCLMERLQRLLQVMPAVYLQGARQTGKTTLAKQLLAAGMLRDYVSFDDPLVRIAAQRDPVSFVRNLQVGTAIDEAQLVPEIMPILKMRIDEVHAPGMFLLTGSTSRWQRHKSPTRWSDGWSSCSYCPFHKRRLRAVWSTGSGRCSQSHLLVRTTLTRQT